MNSVWGFAVIKTLKPALLIAIIGFTSVLLQWWVSLASFLFPSFHY